MGPRGLTAAQISFWDDLLERTANSAPWKKVLETDSVEWLFVKSQPTTEYPKRAYVTVRALLTDLGIIKQ